MYSLFPCFKAKFCGVPDKLGCAVSKKSLWDTVLDKQD